MRATLLALLGLFSCVIAFGNDSTFYKTIDPPADVHETYSEVRSFKQADKQLKTHYVPAIHSNEFSDAYFNKYYHTNAEKTEEKKQEAANTTALVEKESDKRVIDFIAPDKLVHLPVGMVKKLGSGNEKVTIAISKARFTPEYTELTVYCKVELPNAQKVLFLGADGIKLSRTGSFIGDAYIRLLGDFPINTRDSSMVVVFKGGMDMQTGEIEGGTFARLDCSGIKEVTVAGDVLFSRNTFTPLTEGLKPVTDKNVKVKSSFSVSGKSFSDIVVDLSFPSPFTITSLQNNVAFKVEQALWDFSDTRTPADVVFPEEYKNLVSDKPELWKGIFIKEIKVWAVPKEFAVTKEANTPESASFEGNNVIIDRAGLTGDFAFNNLVGNAGQKKREILGCKFSIEKLFLKIEANTLKGGGFAGRLALPVQQVKEEEALNNDNSMGYETLIVPGNKYTFRITEKGEFDMGVWQAKATVDADSYVEVSKNANKWQLKVLLNGSMGVEVKKENASETSKPDQKASASFKGIQFQELVIQNKAPYFQVKHLGYSGTVQLDQFPLSLSDIFVTAQNNEVALNLKVNVSLLDNKISGSAKVTIVGTVKNKAGETGDGTASTGFKPEFSFTRFNVDAMQLSAQFGVVSVDGKVARHKNDPVMGTGWEGAIAMQVKLSDVKTIKVDTKGAFGKKEKQGGGTFSYFYIDGMAYGFEVPLGSSIKAVAFGGGMAMGMSRKASLYEDSTSASGTQYIPDEKAGLALKAMMGIEDMSSTTMKGEVALDIAFTKSWGVAYVGLSGKAYFFPDQYFKGLNDALAVVKRGKEVIEKTEQVADKMEALKKNGKFLEVAKTMYGAGSEIASAQGEEQQDEINPGKITALLGITMDFDNKCLHGNLDIFVDVDLPVLKIKGRWDNNLAGQGVLHVDFREGQGYLYLGTPQQQMGVKVEVPNVLTVTTGTYFMMGTQMPDPAQPPAIVASILGTELYQLKNTRNPNLLRRGAGFAMGLNAGLEAKAGEEKGQKKALDVYVDLAAGFGADIMLRKLGEAYCTSGERIGLNGFQASGDAYLYIKGKCGVRVNIFGINKNIPVVSGTGALLAQAQGPSPLYFKGGIALDVRVLGLPIYKIPRINLAVGRYCEIADPVATGPLAGISMIADVSPKCENKEAAPDTKPGTDPGTGAATCSKVDVFTTPEVAFNMPVGQAFPLSDDDGGVKQYYIRLRKFDLLQNGQRIALKDTFFHSDNTGLNYETTDILPPNSPLKFVVEVGLEQWVDGSWQPVYQDGQMVVEHKEVEFTTGEAPTVIPSENIAFMYPVKDQQYFYPREYNEAYIQLKKGQTYLFREHPEMLEAQFRAADGSVEKAVFRYDSAAQRVALQLPALRNKEKYTYSLVRLPEVAEKANISTETKVIGEGDDALEITEKKIDGEVRQEVEHEFLTYDFSTSRYNTFAEKMKTKKVERSLYEIIQSDVGALQAEVTSGNEGFDIAELKGTEETKREPLIQTQALLTDDYYLQDIKQLLYNTERYGPYGIKVSRDTTKVGFPPARGLDVLPWYTTAVMSNPQYQLLETRAPIRYNVVAYYKEDFTSIQLQAVSRYVKSPNNFPNSLMQYIESGFPLMRNGVYETAFRYVLPGGMVHSSFTFKYTNTIQ